MASERKPYVGPRPFEISDRELFFGRDREAREIKARVIAHPLVLLYAQSGAGKTSLINACLIPDLRAEGFDVLPVARVLRAFTAENGRDHAGNIYAFNVLSALRTSAPSVESVAGSGSDAGKPSDETIASFLERFSRTKDELGEPKPLVFIVDQLEELFSAYPDRWQERRGFLEQLRDAEMEIPLLRILFAMREDYIAHLDPYLDVFPDRLRIRTRLELLREPAAVRAVERPLATTGKRFGEGVAEKIVRELLQVRTRNEQGETVSVQGEFVEPVQLQIVCQTLWESLPAEVVVVDANRLSGIGDVDQALAVFYESIIAQAVKEHKANEGALRKWIDEKLITPGSTRGMVNEQDLQTKRLPPGAIELLVSKHLVRGERRHGSRWFELAHDRFLKPIQESNLRFAQAQRTREEVLERPMSYGAIFASILASFLLLRGSSLWITIPCLLAAAMYGGVAIAPKIGKLRSGENPLPRLRDQVLGLGLAASLASPVVILVATHDWWLLCGYVAALVSYVTMGARVLGARATWASRATRPSTTVPAGADPP